MTPKAEEALTRAVKTIEARSSAEVVVAVRARATSYLHINLLVGIVVAAAALAFLLFCPWEIGWLYLLFDPILVGAVAALITDRSRALQSALSRQSTVDAAVLRAARATFVERGVHHTREGTGVLVFVSLHERACVLVADRAVELAMPQDVWERIESELAGVLRSEGRGTALASAIEATADTWERYLPIDDNDINELSDGVSQ
jgi:putative membrane protein